MSNYIMEREGKNDEQIFAEIDGLTQEQMAFMHRFAPLGHWLFNNQLPYNARFKAAFKGFTPEISKAIGW